MVMKPNISHKGFGVSYILYRVCPLHVSVATHRDVHYKGCITTFYQQMHKCKTLSFKTYGLKCILKYQTNIELLQ